MNSTQNITNIDDLKRAISSLEIQQQQRQLNIQNQFEQLSAQVTHEDFAISQFDRLVKSKFFKVSISRLGLSFFSGLIAKRLLVGKTSGIFGSLAGTLIQAFVARKVMTETENLQPNIQERVADLLRKLKIGS
jgi:hypothetical protein